MNITELPQEVLVNIFSFLPHPPTSDQALACRLFREISQDAALWKHWARRYAVITGNKFSFSESNPTCKTYRLFIKNLKFPYIKQCLFHRKFHVYQSIFPSYIEDLRTMTAEAQGVIDGNPNFKDSHSLFRGHVFDGSEKINYLIIFQNL